MYDADYQPSSGQELVLFGYEEECDSCVLLERSVSASPAQIPA